MRSLLALPLLAATLVASPAYAQDRGRAHRAPDLDQAATLLSNPAVQDQVVALLGQFTDALLDTRVGPVAILTDPRDGIRDDDTLGDVIRRDDPAFDRRLHDNSRRALATTGRALRGASAMERELRATADRLRAVMRQVDRD